MYIPWFKNTKHTLSACQELELNVGQSTWVKKLQSGNIQSTRHV